MPEFIRIGSVIINVRHIIRVSHSGDATTLITPEGAETYRGELGAALWCYFVERAAETEKPWRPEPPLAAPLQS